MIYHNVAEIFETIDDTRSRIYERVESLSAGQENLRASADAWSISEIIEHLAIIEEQLSKVIGMLLLKAEAAASREGGARAEGHAMEPFTLDHFIERSAKEKYQAPEIAVPGGAESLSNSLERLRQSRAALRALQARLEATDLSQAVYPHPAFGPLNLYQWLAFVGLHEDRHLRQIESILNAAAASEQT